jgi:hypothetical protein
MLKSKYISVLFFLISFEIGMAQNQRFKAGFTAGLVATDVDGADTRDGDNDFSKLGFTAGLLLNTELSKKTALQLELNFIQKGSMQRPDSMNNGYYKIGFSYVEFPVLLKRHITFKVRQKPVTRIDLEAGASVGRMVSYQIINGTNSVLPPSNNLFNFTDVSLLAGADYNISKSVIFCLRYSNSIIPVIKRNTPNIHFITYTFNKGNNMVLQFSFKFIFKGKTVESIPKDQEPAK